ncbi:MAG: MCE family protein, partial [Planctomycetes bacterium]|nr:MCE family protein [Planctomycetota bacterium]
MSQVTRTERVKAFLFLLIGLVVIGSVVLTLLHLRKPPRTYFLQFRETVSGLEEGAPVRYKGVKYGKVAKIRVDEDDLETITVELALDEDAPIRVSTVAEIATESIVSKYHIELQGSRLTSPELPEESCIRTRASTLQELLATGETIADSVYDVLNNLGGWTDEDHKDQFFTVLNEIDKTVKEAKQTLNLVKSTFERGGDGARLLEASADVVEWIREFL